MKIDLLKELYEKKITSDQAYEIYDEIMETDSTNVRTDLGLSESEWTIFCHGFGFDNLVHVRYK